MDRSAVLSDEQRRTLAELSTLPGVASLYLAGGTAIALRLGHRHSLDLDFFSLTREFDLTTFRIAATAREDAAVVAATDAVVRLRWRATTVDVVRYSYAPLDAPDDDESGVRLASMRDLAAMNLAAVSQRGIRRDFWDLYEITTTSPVTLVHALDDYRTKFGLSDSDLYHVLRSLTYFDDAERDVVLPLGMEAALWARVRSHFETAAPAELARRLGGSG